MRPLRYLPFVLATGNNLQSIVRQRPLQRLGFIPGRPHPHVAFFIGRQDYRYRLWDDRPRRLHSVTPSAGRRRDAVPESASIWCRDRRGIRSISCEQRLIVKECEPGDVFLFRHRICPRRVFCEAVGWDQAPVFRLQPPPPVRRPPALSLVTRNRSSAVRVFSDKGVGSRFQPVHANCIRHIFPRPLCRSEWL